MNTFSSVHGSFFPPVRAAILRFSVTDSDEKISLPWGMSPMPKRAILYGGRPTSSCPLNEMLPLRGGVSPMMERMVVVLPIPLRPKSATTVASFTSRDTPWRT